MTTSKNKGFNQEKRFQMRYPDAFASFAEDLAKVPTSQFPASEGGFCRSSFSGGMDDGAI